MIANSNVLVINTLFPEVNYLASGLAEAKLLSRYVRPYANLGRNWENTAARFPGLGNAYARSFGRRRIPAPLGAEHLVQAGLCWDFAMAVHLRLPIRATWYRCWRHELINRVVDAVAQAGARRLLAERMVVASWSCALPAFELAHKRGMIRVLNYSIAHPAFSRRYLTEEAEREPNFAGTLNVDDNWPLWQTLQLDREIELADYILVGSSFAKKSFIAEGIPESKLCVIPYGVDTNLFTPPEEAKPTKAFNLLFIGQLTQRKGLSYLLEAYKRIHGPDTTLTVIGQVQDDGAALQPWRHLIRHVPPVPRPQLAQFLQAADVFVFPTLVEGMPIVVLEAMASGLPVITTPNGPGDVVRDQVDGFLVSPRDVDAIVEQLEQLRVNPELRAEMGQNARQRAEKYTWRVYQKTAVHQLNDWLELQCAKS